MKKKLLIVCALFLGTSIHSQYITTSGTVPGATQVYKAGSGTGSLHWPYSGGLLIQSSTGDRGLLEIQDPTGTNRTVFQALSYGTYLDASNSGVGLPLYVNSGGGSVAIGTTSPDRARLHVDFNAGPNAYGSQWGTKSIIRQTSIGVPGYAFHPFIAIEGNATTYYSNHSWMYGVIGTATNGQQNIGGSFTASGNGDYNNIGLHATAYGNANSLKNWAARFDGQTYCTSGVWHSSDLKLKEDITPFTGALDKIKLLKPSTYTYKRDEELNDLQLPEEKQIGLIAQDLEEVFPDLVREISQLTRVDENGEVVFETPAFKSIQYTSLIPVLIAGIQEQQTLIEAQQAQLDEQKEMITQLLQNSGQSLNTTVNPTTPEGFLLGQNQPNPFNGQTVIPFTLPNNVSTAYMAIYDLSGKEITTLPINDRGASQLVFSAENLSPGMYIYSIVADGKVLDSKRMTVANK